MRVKAGLFPVRILSTSVLVIFAILCGCQRSSKDTGQITAEKYKSARKTVVLTDNWRFQIDIRNIGEKERWFADDFDRNTWANVTVPQAWDCYETALWGYEGIGWYATTIHPDDFITGKRVEILFNRVMYCSKIWLNGEYIGENIGGYLPFSFNITDYLKPGRENTLVMRVDNVPRIEWLPAAKQIEWIQYGGILQKVQLVSTSHTYIDDFTIRTATDNEGARISCIANIVNETDIESEMDLNVAIARDTSITSGSVKVRCKANESARVQRGSNDRPRRPVVARYTGFVYGNGKP